MQVPVCVRRRIWHGSVPRAYKCIRASCSGGVAARQRRCAQCAFGNVRMRYNTRGVCAVFCRRLVARAVAPRASSRRMRGGVSGPCRRLPPTSACCSSCPSCLLVVSARRRRGARRSSGSAGRPAWRVLQCCRWRVAARRVASTPVQADERVSPGWRHGGRGEPSGMVAFRH